MLCRAQLVTEDFRLLVGLKLITGLNCIAPVVSLLLLLALCLSLLSKQLQPALLAPHLWQRSKALLVVEIEAVSSPKFSMIGVASVAASL